MVAKFPTKLVKKLDRARVDFNEPEIRRFLLQHGLPLTWESAARCPCTREIPGFEVGFYGRTGEPQTNTGCTECGGRGVIYYNAQDVTAFLLSASQDQGLRQLYGERSSGMVRVTVPPEQKPTVGDRYTAQNNVYATDETRTRTAATVESLRFPIVEWEHEVGSAADPTVPEVRTLGVAYCRRTDADGNLLSNVLVEDVDFTVTAAGDIDWTLGDGLGTAPVEGARYSLKYYSHPEYIVHALPYQHRDQFIRVRSPSSEKQPDLKYTQLPIHVHCWFVQLAEGY